MGWLNTFLEDDGRTWIHTVPIEDTIDHLETRECVCVPRWFQVLGNGAAYTWQVVHASLDGRELSE